MRRRASSAICSCGTPKGVAAEIRTLLTHLDYLRAKAALWDARDSGP